VKRILPAILAAVAACSTGSLQEEGRREWRGVSTQVTLEDLNPALGNPLRVRLELHNRGSTPLTYNDHIDMGCFAVVGPGGENVPYIGWIAQSFASDTTLAPGESVSLLEHQDLSIDYLFERPGRYRIRFTGGGLALRKTGGEGPGFHPVHLVSNWVEVRVGEGRPAPVVEVVRRLRETLPKEWSIGTGVGGNRMTIRLLRRNPWVPEDEVWLRIGDPPEKGDVRFGESRWGPVWLSRTTRVGHELLPALREALIRT
jgi:hypothetical protein